MQGGAGGRQGTVPPPPKLKKCCRKMMLFPRALFLETSFQKFVFVVEARKKLTLGLKSFVETRLK